MARRTKRRPNKKRRRKNQKFRRVKRRKSKKKSISKRLNARQNWRSDITALPGFQPMSKRVTLKYACIITFPGLASGANDYITFAANGLYAPAVTGGHQCYGYDQITPYYKEYQVRSSKIRYTPMIGGGTTSAGTDVFWPGLRGQSTGYNPVARATNTTIALENGQTKMSQIRQYSFNTTNNEGIHLNSKAMTTNFRLSKSKSVLKEDEPAKQWIPTGSNPNSTTSVLFIYFLSRTNEIMADSGTNRVPATTGPMSFWVEIEYDVVFRDPINISQS